MTNPVDIATCGMCASTENARILQQIYNTTTIEAVVAAPRHYPGATPTFRAGGQP